MFDKNQDVSFRLVTSSGCSRIELASAIISGPEAAGVRACEMRDWLHSFQSTILIPIELPAILSAYRFASRNDIQGLIELDQSLGQIAAFANFHEASRRTGQKQSKILTGYRATHKIADRFLSAVAKGTTDGCHTTYCGLSIFVKGLDILDALERYEKTVLVAFAKILSRRLKDPLEFMLEFNEYIERDVRSARHPCSDLDVDVTDR